jgi:UDP-2,3-diacylglucosamine hydrolase
MAGAPAACAAQPAARELQVPDSWHAIDFVSDLHLCQAMPRTFAGFQRHLQTTTANAVFILGDLFELWVGDDMVQQPFERRCVQALHAASERLTLAFMAGNRDFLVGPQLLLQAGMLGLHEPTVLQAFGQRVLLSHGDAWCLDDLPYQAFRQEVRSDAWQFRFLAQSLPERLQVAQQIRSASRERQRFDGAADTDVHIPTALQHMQAAQATVLVHGHTHRPASQMLAPGCERHVLSDWDLDDGQGLGPARRAEVLRLDRAGFRRLSLPSR